jgi:acylphosphatase
MIRAHVYISGVVQGVGYRYSAMRAARSLAVTGWVKNLPDGRVEAVIEGPAADVEQMIGWCRQGPSGSRVSGVEVTYLPYQGEFGSFDLAW